MKEHDCALHHIESRPTSNKEKKTYEIYLEMSCSQQKLVKAVNSINDIAIFPNITILGSDEIKKSGKHIKD